MMRFGVETVGKNNINERGVEEQVSQLEQKENAV